MQMKKKLALVLSAAMIIVGINVIVQAASNGDAQTPATGSTKLTLVNKNSDPSDPETGGTKLTLVIKNQNPYGPTTGGSSGSGGGALSRPPVITQNGAVNNNPNTNNDTPEGSNVPVSQYAHANAGKALPLIRMYNPASGEHILTTDGNEAATLETQHGWKREAMSGTSSAANNSPVYRLIHPATGKHILSTSANEIKVLTEKMGWKTENVVFFAGGSKIKMFRLNNPNLPAALSHFWTTDEDEYNALQEQGWIGEGVAFTLD